VLRRFVTASVASVDTDHPALAALDLLSELVRAAQESRAIAAGSKGHKGQSSLDYMTCDHIEGVLRRALLPFETSTEEESAACPTCGSDDPKVRRVVGWNTAPKKPCPDPWHQSDTESP
jgi:hypothetical protein